MGTNNYCPVLDHAIPNVFQCAEYDGIKVGSYSGEVLVENNLSERLPQNTHLLSLFLLKYP